LDNPALAVSAGDGGKKEQKSVSKEKAHDGAKKQLRGFG